MSIVNNILFLQDYTSDERRPDAPAQSYAQGYGNRVASARVFAPLGHAHPADHGNASASERVPLRACG